MDFLKDMWDDTPKKVKYIVIGVVVVVVILLMT